MGRKGKKAQDDYWDGEFEEDLEQGGEEKEKEETTVKPSKDKTNNKKGGKAKVEVVKKEESEDEEEEVVVKPKGKAASKAKPQPKKAKEVESDESDNEEEEVVVKPKAGKAASKGKPQPKKAKEVESDEENESDESDDEKEEEVVQSNGKGSKSAPKKSVVKEEPKQQPQTNGAKSKGKKNKKDDYWDGEFEEDLEVEEETPKEKESEKGKKKGESKKEEPPKKNEKGGKSNNNKKKKDEDEDFDDFEPAEDTKTKKGGKKEPAKPAKEAEKPVEKKPEPELEPEPEEKKGKPNARGKALAEMLKAKREEEERIQKEREEAEKKFKEQIERKIAEDEKLEAEKEKRKEKNKIKAKEKEKRKAEEEKVKKAQLALERLKLGNTLVGGPTKQGTQQPKKNNNKKSDKQEKSEEAKVEEVVDEKKEEEQVEAKVEEEEEEEEDDDWESNWEKKELGEKEKPVEKVEEKVEVKVEVKNKQPEREVATASNSNKKDTKKGGKEKPKEQKAPESEEQVEKPEEAEVVLRSPICCILGHVDTGKTSLLDKIRHTNVQEGEAGGITQQIGATFFPIENIREQTKSLQDKLNLSVRIPGLLVIDTPGHESFTNLRSRGTSVCDLAILVVDIMHGLEPQTLESINILRMKKTPFIVALNKVDRIYGWRATPNSPFRESLKNQQKSCAIEFDTRVKETITAFAEQSLNATLYYHNKDFRKYVSLVPTSAVTGEGIPDLLLLITQLTEKMMAEKLGLKQDLECIVLEVKALEGLGTTVDVILVNGELHEGDQIVACGLNGPIVSKIQALLTPQPMKELRVKGQYIQHKTIKASMGIKIVAHDMEKAVAGTSIMVAQPGDDIDQLKEQVQKDLQTVLADVDTSGRGVYVQASTLGSLEALLSFLKTSKIPVSAVNIGPVHKKDVFRASVMLEKAKDYAVVLAFDVKVEKEAQAVAEEMGVRIFTADIIYHLFDQFTKYIEELTAARRGASEAIWPVQMSIFPNFIFNKRNPIVVGVKIEAGTLRLQTPIVCFNKEANEKIILGVVSSIEHNHKNVEKAKKGDEVAIKIEATTDPAPMYGRQFDENTGDLYSNITRESIDVLKDLWAKDITKEDKILIANIKKLFGIM